MTANTDFRKNNLDCLRLILASTVALFHISALSNLPAFSVFDRYLSPHFAVKGFFIISGMLIYRSYTQSSSIRSYLEKRARRIYPAYFTVVIASALTLCSLTTVPLSEYFGVGFWKYLAGNLVFLNFLAPRLPGVFTSHDNSAVNGALWTLKIEVAFYLCVPMLHYLFRRFGIKRALTAAFFLSCLWKYGFALLSWIYSAPNAGSRNIFQVLQVQFPAQFAYFAAGILLLVYFDTLKRHFALIACASAALFAIDHSFSGEILDIFWISGVVFTCGFWRYLGNFSKYGDFSYGVYIVHWPILQTLIALGAVRLNPLIFLSLSLCLIAMTAFLLWHLVEKKFLTRGSHYRQVSNSESISTEENALHVGNAGRKT